MVARKTNAKSPATAVEEQLARYRSMRDFETTSEPRGSTSRYGAVRDLPFVVQKHAATRLHYDFRLGWRGVLKSWAVTKGPSYFPGDKRLAVQVEDHPMEYGGFEGVIPQGQYGGGTVMVWDQGTWQPHGDVEEGLKNGALKFALNGSKLKGNWALIRMGGRAAQERKPNWLLIKEHDEFERENDDPPVTTEEPDSVVTGRDLEAIAAQEDHVWSSSEKKKTIGLKPSGGRRATRPASASLPPSRVAIADTPKDSLPKFVSPQLAIQAKIPPEGEGWIHELKLDGYRIQARIDLANKDRRNRVTLLTRGGLDWTLRMPDLAAALVQLQVKTALLDGEVVVVTPSGGTSFADLQAAFQDGKRTPLTYFVFDLLHLDGHNLRELKLDERKRLLQEVIKSSSGDGSRVRFSEHLETDGAAMFASACRLGAEGIVSKRASGKYVSGRSPDWIKVKCVTQQEFVIGGFTLPSKGGPGMGALLLGYYKGGKLVYAGRTGSGFTQKAHRLLREQLDDLRTEKTPFHQLPAGEKRNAIWVKPKLVAEVSFATWTADNLLRQAAFKGLREDKPPREVVREHAVARNDIAGTTGADPATGKTPRHPKSLATTKSDGSIPVRLTHPDKVIDPESKVSKEELAEYYWAIAPYMLPHVAHRPLSLVRCPEGSGKPCFFQKHINSSLPTGVESVEIRTKKGIREEYISLSTPEALTGLAQIGVLEVHPWGSRNESLETPDRLVIDLDPDDSIPWSTLSASAREVRDRLKGIGLESFVKSTGGKGLHVVAPIEPEYEWPIVKEFARVFANEMAAGNPELYLTKMTKAARKGKIYVDYLRNERGATSIAPFSPRAQAGLPVAMPLDWKELDEKRPPRFLVADFSKWGVRLRRDPWKRLFDMRQSFSGGFAKLGATSQSATGGRRAIR